MVTLSDLKFFRYKIPFKKELILKKGSHDHRQGVVIVAESHEGRTGLGEIAPLPGFHRETLDQAINNCLQIAPTLIGKTVPRSILDYNNSLQHFFRPDTLFPSVQTGMEMALIDLFTIKPSKPIAVNGLVTRSTSEQELEALIRAKFTTLKIKVGVRPIIEEADHLLRLYHDTDGKIQFRLDANRAWELAEALHFARMVKGLPIEYIEEPVKRVQDQTLFFNKTEMPVALDETLLENPPDSMLIRKGVKALILKPSLLRGFDHTARLIRFARERNLIWVLTSAFESSLALGAFCRFAQQFEPGDTAMGLNTHTWFEKEFITPVTVIDGQMHCLPKENRVLDHSMLQEIDLEGGNKP